MPTLPKYLVSRGLFVTTVCSCCMRVQYLIFMVFRNKENMNLYFRFFLKDKSCTIFIDEVMIKHHIRVIPKEGVPVSLENYLNLFVLLANGKQKYKINIIRFVVQLTVNLERIWLLFFYLISFEIMLVCCKVLTVMYIYVSKHNEEWEYLSKLLQHFQACALRRSPLQTTASTSGQKRQRRWSDVLSWQGILLSCIFKSRTNCPLHHPLILYSLCQQQTLQVTCLYMCTVR